MIYRVSALDTALAPSTSSPVVQWKWPRRGIVSEVFVGVRSGLATHLAALGIQIYDGRKPLCEDGLQDAFANVAALVGTGEDDSSLGEWFPLWRAVDESLTPWTIQLTNVDAALVVTPRVMLKFLETDE